MKTIEDPRFLAHKRRVEAERRAQAILREIARKQRGPAQMAGMVGAPVRKTIEQG